MSQGEFDLVAELRALFAEGPEGPAIRVGIGDDAAVIAGSARQLVVSVDAQVEHVHFERAWLTGEDIGYRAFTTALSDLAAMGAEPTAALSALIVPAAEAGELVRAITRGQAEAARAYGCPVVGGNLARGPSLSVTTTVLGRVPRPLLRSGARVGDGVFVAGALGLAAAGLRAFQLGRDGPELAEARAAWRRPTARLDEGRTALPSAHAGIDLSDGLGQDLGHLAAESHVAISLERAALKPFADALASVAGALQLQASAAEEAGLEATVDPWSWVLFGGEDYSLAITAPEAPSGFVRVGSVVAGHGVSLDGSPLGPAGHRHF